MFGIQRRFNREFAVFHPGRGHGRNIKCRDPESKVFIRLNTQVPMQESAGFMGFIKKIGEKETARFVVDLRELVNEKQ